jgi:hypothetical protein
MIFAQLGMTLMLVALFCAAVAEHLVGQPLFDANRPMFAAGLGAFGALLILLGAVAAKRRQNKKLPDPGKLVEFLEPRFWGVVVILLGVLTFNFQSWNLDVRWLELRARMDGKVEIVQAREPAETNQTTTPTPPKALAVPAIKIQGIIYKKERSVVLIGGESFSVGDSIDDAVIEEIQRDGIVVRIGQETRTIRMGTGRGTNSVISVRK